MNSRFGSANFHLLKRNLRCARNASFRRCESIGAKSTSSFATASEGILFRSYLDCYLRISGDIIADALQSKVESNGEKVDMGRIPPPPFWMS